MATKSRENKRAISALKKDGWKEHTSGMFYEHPMGTSILIQLRWMKIFRPLFVDSVLEQVNPDLPYNTYILIKTNPALIHPYTFMPQDVLVLGTSPNITSLMATLRLLGEI